MKEKRLREIFENFLDAVKNDEDTGDCARQEFADYIEEYFDHLCEDDYFGTEGQNHPFGDKRN